MSGPKARLTDIEVEEVSGVDRAANKRRFIVKKSEGEMTDEERAAEAAAAAEAEKTKKAAEAAAAEEAEKAKKAAEEAEKARKAKEEADAAAEAEKAKKAAEAEAEETKKAAATHLALLTEKRDALVKGAEKLLASIDALDMTEAMSHLSAMSDILWRARDEMAVVKLAKAESAVVEQASARVNDVAKAASRVDAKIAVLIAKGCAPAGAPGKKPDEMAKADPPWADILVALSAIAEGVGKIAGCMAEDSVEMAEKRAAEKAALAKASGGGDAASVLAAVEKAVKEVASRVSKLEKAEPPPNGSGPAGRSSVAKSEPDWPADMAAASK